ncbi:hypothetical protein ES703_69887 [subsurface metagenome]
MLRISNFPQLTNHSYRFTVQHESRGTGHEPRASGARICAGGFKKQGQKARIFANFYDFLPIFSLPSQKTCAFGAKTCAFDAKNLEKLAHLCENLRVWLELFSKKPQKTNCSPPAPYQSPHRLGKRPIIRSFLLLNYLSHNSLPSEHNSRQNLHQMPANTPKD